MVTGSEPESHPGTEPATNYPAQVRRSQTGPRRRLICTALSALIVSAVALPAAADPAATPSGASPTAPNPHPPQGLGPDGQIVGGMALAARKLVVKAAGTPALPAGMTAQGWVLANLDTGQILAARDAHGEYQPASILKTLTSLVLLPQLPGNRVITASAEAANAEGSAVGIVAGGKYSIDTLFKGLLLESGNDAAMALADAAGGPTKVVDEMNETAKALGAYDTTVQTVSGLDGWTQLTSAYDMSLVLRQIVNNPRFIAYDQTPRATLPIQNVAGKAWHSVGLWNQGQPFFDNYPGALLEKIGYTDAAQHTYLTAAKRNGVTLGVVMLRAQREPTDQWQQADALMDWGFTLPTTTAGIGTLISPVSPLPSFAAPAVTTTSAPSGTPGPTSKSAAAGQTGQASKLARVGGLSTQEPVAAELTHHSGFSKWALLNGLLIALVAVVVVLRVRQFLRHRRAH
jgi:D-alanyl-D-alanine carboxypeptidase (penicillin-binding protein 5/6)